MKVSQIARLLPVRKNVQIQAATETSIDEITEAKGNYENI